MTDSTRRAGTRSLQADAPSRTLGEDRLNRAPLGRAIAAAIARWPGEDSIVIALTGPWGSGKSTVKNFVLEILATEFAARPFDVLEFNPWRDARGPSDLTSLFLQGLGQTLELDERGQRDATRARAWNAYAARLQSGAVVAEGIGGGLTQGALAAAVLGFGVHSVAADRWGGVSLAVGWASTVIAAAAKWGGRFASSVATSVGARGAVTDRSTEALRGRASDALKSRARPVLVVLDDVDRLAASEIAELFALIKASAALPNILYFVLFQRDLVEQSLEAVAPGARPHHGRAYLEKIVQASFTLPAAEPVLLERLLFAGLNNIIADPAFDRHFDHQRWGNLYVGALRVFFTSPRDVHRFLNTLDFHAGIFRSPTVLEVNPIDLIGMEVLRVFEPDVHDALRRHKSLLVETRHFDDSESRRKRDAQRLRRIFARGHKARRKAIETLVRLLFPATERALRNNHFTESDAWLRDLRVCHEEMFDRYFFLTAPEGTVSQEDVERMLGAAGDRSEALRLLRPAAARPPDRDARASRGIQDGHPASECPSVCDGGVRHR